MPRIDLVNPWQRAQAAAFIKAARREGTRWRRYALLRAAQGAKEASYCVSDMYMERTALRFVAEQLAAGV